MAAELQNTGLMAFHISCQMTFTSYVIAYAINPKLFGVISFLYLYVSENVLIFFWNNRFLSVSFKVCNYLLLVIVSLKPNVQINEKGFLRQDAALNNCCYLPIIIIS